jgi:transposase
LRRANRRDIEDKASAIQGALRSAQLRQPRPVQVAYAAIVTSQVQIINILNVEIGELGQVVADHFGRHRDAERYLSLPGLGPVLGARILGEFGDDPHRYPDAKARKNYAGTSPITRASGSRKVVLARYARNRRIGDAVHQWAFCAMRGSPGARTYYQALRARGIGHQAALRQLGNSTGHAAAPRRSCGSRQPPPRWTSCSPDGAKSWAAAASSPRPPATTRRPG